MKLSAFAGLLLTASTAIASAALLQTKDVQQNPPLSDAAPKLPSPSGPFGVGRVGYDWIDTTRSDRYSTDPQAHRELMVYLWYPTSQKVEDVRGTYLPGAKQMDTAAEIQSRMRDKFAANWPLIVLGAIFSHAVEGTPVAENPRQFPVVIFSHGRAGTGFEYTSLIEDLASHGYVIAAIEHTESAIMVRFPNGKMVPFHEDSLPQGLSPEERFKRMGASISRGINEGADDVRFVLNNLTKLNAGDARDFLLAGRLDLNRVAAMGHSAGAEFAARACQVDTRFRACVDLDGGMVPIAALPDYGDGATLKQPLLFLEANHPESQMGGTQAQHAEYFKKKEAQLETSAPGSYDVVLKSAGIGHSSFSDYPLLAAADKAVETSAALHNLDLAETFIRAFLDKNLKQQKAPLLDDANVALPEATVQHYGRP